MQQQERTRVANDVEDTAADGQARMVHRMMRRVVQRGLVERRQLGQVAHREHPIDFEHVGAFVQPEFGREHPAMNRVDAGEHFEPHDWRETAVAQLGFDQREQVVGLVLVALGVGVARHAEKLVRVDQHRGKQQIEIVRDDVLEPHKIILLADPQEARDSEADRHFHPRHQRIRIVLIARRDQQIERQVRHERKRMRRVHRLRRHQRKNILVVVVANRLALVVRKAGVEPHPNAVVLELAQNMRTDFALPMLELAHHRVAFR